VMTLHLEPPEADTEVGCCLPDGSCEVRAAADCIAAAGQVTAVGPLGDLDGDGIDDGCAYPADRLTFFAPSVRLTSDSLSAMVEYERLVQMLAGAPGPRDRCADRCGEEPPPDDPFREPWCYCVHMCCINGCNSQFTECLVDLGIPTAGTDIVACLLACGYHPLACAVVCGVGPVLIVWRFLPVCMELHAQCKAGCDYAYQRCTGGVFQPGVPW